MAAAPERPVACGIGCGGPMNPIDRTVSPLHIPSWVGLFPWPTRSRQDYATAVLENDAKAMALGESWCGAAVDVADLVGRGRVGAGVGGGIVAGGAVRPARQRRAHRPCHRGPDRAALPVWWPGVPGGVLQQEWAGHRAGDREVPLAPRRPSSSAVGCSSAGPWPRAAAVVDLRLAVVEGDHRPVLGEPFFATANAGPRRRASSGVAWPPARRTVAAGARQRR